MIPPQKDHRETLRQDIVMVRHFKDHLEAIADTKNLDLLYLSDAQPIANEDACKLLGVERTGAWRWLSDLRRLGLLEKKGHTYRMSDYARELIASESLVFRGLVKGEFPEVGQVNLSKEVIAIAREGVEALYERGRLTQEEYSRRLALIHSAEAATAPKS